MKEGENGGVGERLRWSKYVYLTSICHPPFFFKYMCITYGMYELVRLVLLGFVLLMVDE